MKNKTSEYEQFDAALRRLLCVSHGEIKAKLEAEKKFKKRKKAGQSSASREAGGQR